jgi:hypothetical protein
VTVRIGIDFDNTLAGYDGVFTRLAEEWGLLTPGHTHSKQQIRALARQKDELLWQRIQGEVYGLRMYQAEQFAGEDRFLSRCAAATDIEIFIVSHKTQFGHFDETFTDLREAARSWMRNQGFFGQYAIAEQNLFFEATQEEKILRIASLECDIFIDDLAEVFEHPSFPENTRKILFSTERNSASSDVTICSDWSEIEVAVFGN